MAPKFWSEIGPNGARTDPERAPNEPRTNPERTPNEPSATRILCDTLLHVVTCKLKQSPPDKNQVCVVHVPSPELMACHSSWIDKKTATQHPKTLKKRPKTSENFRKVRNVKNAHNFFPQPPPQPPIYAAMPAMPPPLRPLPPFNNENLKSKKHKSGKIGDDLRVAIK